MAIKEIWYPSESLLLKVHASMIRKYGGYEGFEIGITPFYQIIKDAKEIDGLYLKAAVILKGIVTTRIFQDGHHRTGCAVTQIFLNKNGLDYKEKYPEKVSKFVKEIRCYSINQIAKWIEYGKI